MAKMSKEFKQEKQIAEGLATIREARESVEDLAKRYDEWIDKAAELGEDDYSDQLISDQVDLEDFGRNLEFFEVRIVEGAVSARAFNKLKALPNVLDCCKSLLKKGLDLPKIGKQMSSFKNSLDKARTSLGDLRGELSKSKDPIYVELFGQKKKVDAKVAEKIEAKKQAREARLIAKFASGAVSPVASGTVAESPATEGAGIDSITQMIDEERKKK